MAYGTKNAKVVDSVDFEHANILRYRTAFARAIVQLKSRNGLAGKRIPVIVDGGSDSLPRTPDAGMFILATYVGQVGKARADYTIELCDADAMSAS